jgi:hypothetical protein
MKISADESQGFEPVGDIAEVAKPREAPSAALDESAQTVAVWRSYLPEDCVATMIKMGWHLPT